MAQLALRIQTAIAKYRPFLSNRVFHATLWYVVGVAVEKGIYVLGVTLFTRLLSPEQYGTISLFTTWTSLFVIVFSFNIYPALRRFYHEQDESIYKDYVSSALMFGLCVFVVVIGVLLLLPTPWFETIFSLQKPFIVLAMVAVLLEYPMQILRAVWWESYSFKSSVIYTTALAALNTVLSVVFILLIPHLFADALDTEYGRVGGIIAANVVLLLFLVPNRKRIGALHINWKYVQMMLIFALPMLPGAISNIVLSQSDRIIIDAQVGRFATGLYSYGYQIGQIFYMVMFATNKAWSPWFMQKLNQMNYGLVTRRNRQYLIMMAAFTGVAIIVSPVLVLILAPSEYHQAIHISPIVVASTYFLFLYTQLSTYLMYAKKTWAISLAMVVAGSTNIVLNLIFVPQFGYVAAAWTTLFAYGCLALVSWRMARPNFPASYQLFGSRLMLGLGVALCGVAAVVSSLVV